MKHYPTCRTRKLKQDLSRFMGLVGSPADLTTGVVLPANAQLYASSSAVIVSPVAVVTIKDVPFALPPGNANGTSNLQYAEAGVTVQKAAGAPGIITLYIRGNLGQLLKIAEG